MTNTNIKFPQIVNLCILRGKCHCNCVHCPVGIEKQSQRKSSFGFSSIDLDVFERFCKEISTYDTIVRLHAVGEPTQHPKIFELLEIISKRKLKEKFWMFTDGILDDNLIHKIATTLGLVEFSINSIESDDYLATKGLDTFDKVKTNIYKMRDEIRSTNSSTRIVLTRVEAGNNNDEEFVSYWKNKGFECFVRSYHSYSNILNSLQDGDSKLAPGLPKCLVPWKRFNLDGTLDKESIVAVNCFNVLFQHPDNIKDNVKMGAFPNSKLIEIWNNDEFNKFRKKLQKHELTYTACDDCNECMTEEGLRSENLIFNEEC